MEQQYLLPSTRDGRIKEVLGISEREMAVMRQRDSLELPSNFVVRCQTKENKAASKFPKFVEFQGFKLSTKFPDNVCLLKSGKVILCSDIKKNPEDPFNPIISGHAFTKRIPTFNDHVGNSEEIELFTVSNIEVENSEYEARDIHSKCFICPDFKCFNIVEDKDYVDPLSCLSSARSAKDDEERLDFMEKFERTSSKMKWTVQSLELRKSS